MKSARLFYNRQKGQALLIALVMLALGGLMIGPLMGLVTSGVKVGEVVENNVRKYYAADSGIEDALWKLQSWYKINKLSPGTPLPPDYSVTVNGEAINVQIGRPDPVNFPHTFVVVSTGTGIQITASLNVQEISLASIMNSVATTPGSIEGNKKVIFDPDWGEDHGPNDSYSQSEWDIQTEALRAYYAQFVQSDPSSINPFPNSTIDVANYQTRTGQVNHTGGYAAGTTSIVVDGIALGGIIGAGSVVTFNGVAGDFQVTTNTTISGGSATITIKPGLPVPVSDDTVITFGGIGGIYRNGALTIVNTGGAGLVLDLKGSFYITGDTNIGGTNQNFYLDLNGNVVYVDSATATWALEINGKCSVLDSGGFIVRGGLYFAPNGDTEPTEYILAISFQGTLQVRPGINIYGTLAGDIKIDVQSGSTPTVTWVDPETVGWVNIPGIAEIIVADVLSYEIQ